MENISYFSLKRPVPLFTHLLYKHCTISACLMFREKCFQCPITLQLTKSTLTYSVTETNSLPPIVKWKTLRCFYLSWRNKRILKKNYIFFTNPMTLVKNFLLHGNISCWSPLILRLGSQLHTWWKTLCPPHIRRAPLTARVHVWGNRSAASCGLRWKRWKDVLGGRAGSRSHITKIVLPFV